MDFAGCRLHLWVLRGAACIPIWSNIAPGLCLWLALPSYAPRTAEVVLNARAASQPLGCCLRAQTACLAFSWADLLLALHVRAEFRLCLVRGEKVLMKTFYNFDH